ncbi:uncharacterized protein LOC109842409 [Asparagus officinalis]|uniref:uncharacterized protein LOC109842409 n=1 Tax=Asparagus officinalis TaxID=4686 RepID=UPI00098E36FE|nr:uncharacterized protein LOC109842409 [Asparagus officinalis]
MEIGGKSLGTKGSSESRSFNHSVSVQVVSRAINSDSMVLPTPSIPRSLPPPLPQHSSQVPTPLSPLAQPQASSAQRPRPHRLESLSRPPPEPAPHKSQPYLTALRGSDQLPAKLPSAQGLRRFAIYTRPSALVILRPKNSKARNKNHIPPPLKILNLDPIQVNLIKRKRLIWVKDHFKVSSSSSLYFIRFFEDYREVGPTQAMTIAKEIGTEIEIDSVFQLKRQIRRKRQFDENVNEEITQSA